MRSTGKKRPVMRDITTPAIYGDCKKRRKDLSTAWTDYQKAVDSVPQLLGKSEEDLENEIKIVKAISKDINMTSGLQKCVKICLKTGLSPEKTIHREHI
jgi:phage-related tail protein